MSIRQCVVILLTISSMGCVCIQDCEYRAAQRFRAHSAWWFGCDERCSTNPISDYACGWRQGYTDVLMGGDGECPPVPPPCYWSFKYQSEHGEIAIENWFQGYGDGAAAALAACRDQYNSVPLSNEFRNNGLEALPSDFAPYDFGRTTLAVKRKLPAEAEDSDSSIPRVPAAPNAYENDDEESPSPSSANPIDEPDIPPAPAAKPAGAASTRSSNSSKDRIKQASFTKWWSSKPAPKVHSDN